LMHAYQLRGNVLDYLLVFNKAADSAYAYRALPVAAGYLLMAGVFLAMGARQANGKVERRSGDTLEDARVVSASDVNDESELPE